MDVDMAMQLSRARRETNASLPFETHPPSSLHHQLQERSRSPERDAFPAMLDEEDEMHYDHEGAGRLDLSGMDMTRGGDGDTVVPRRTRSDPSLHHAPTHPTSHTLDPTDPSSSHYGLPTYQANTSRSNFDFSRMEDFAAVEKAHLGIGSPVATRFAPDRFPRRPSPTGFPSADLGEQQPPLEGLMPRFGEASSSVSQIRLSSEEPMNQNALSDDNASENFQRPLRHRKISQSNSARPRPPRKGIGGKISLFESAPTDPVPRLPPLISSNLATSSGLNPYSDFVITATGGGQQPNGILNPTTPGQGHDRPYRFSFYSNALSATIHARSLSELPAEGQSFEDLFAGNQPAAPPPPFQSSASNGAVHDGHLGTTPKDRPTSSLAFSPPPPPPPGYLGHKPTPSDGASVYASSSRRMGLQDKPGDLMGQAPNESDNTWWLDVMCPTDEEMKMLSKVFNIHPLTTEDILMEETREKIELFRNYYLVCFRSFDQDPYSPTHLEPLNMYIIVFREGTLSFHFRPTPHPQNVRRRIKQLKDYISVTSDWISYALIDDITDAFGPLIQSIEYEVDSIDELVLILKEAEQSDMLRRIGTCRKKVMGLLRLMGNKADVVKGLAKRCNENWRVAPTSDIGLYLSDIQDHLITMTQNLNHYEKILSRSHSNYLAQISIEMTDANNQINDVLSKLTALGTVLIPMNLVTGLWGMNVHVPGQDIEQGYVWFASIIACLAAFALIGGYSTYKFMVRR